MSKLSKTVREIIKNCGVPTDGGIHLADFDTTWAGPKAASKDELRAEMQALLEHDIERLSTAQDLLYASDTWSMLLIFQAMDAAGKDSTIKHVMSGINPQGCQVTSFKQPSSEELDHDFLWRCNKAPPERGRIGIFNRSYYEEVLVVRVHPELLAKERIPDSKPGKRLWRERYQDINAFERHLTRNGTRIVKFFLHVSREEQKKRFLDRIEDPSKHWKFSASDVAERECWDDYAQAYEDCLNHTSTKHAPWHVIPADQKWVMRTLVATIITQTILKLDLNYPKVTKEQAERIAVAKKQLEEEPG